MELATALYLAGCVAGGFGLTYLCGLRLDFEERIVFGAVLGTAAVVACSFVASMVVGSVTAVTSVGGLAVVLLAGTSVALGHGTTVAAEAADAARRWRAPLRTAGHPWPLAAILVVCGIWTVHFLHQAFVYTPTGLVVGYVNIWGDWAAHLSFAGSFAYGQNFPPQFSIDPGHNLGYPFMIDFFAADLVPLGLPLTGALTASTGLLLLAFPAVLYLAARRFAGGRAAAAIAVFVFLLSGGLGFVQLIGDVQHGGSAALVHLVREYTLNRDLNYQWLNPVLAYLIPQRSTLFGFSLALIVLLILWLAVREHAGWQPFLFAGAITAVMPVYHVHAYGTCIALAAFWALLFSRRRQWLGFFVPAVVVGVPILAWMWPPANNSYCSGQSSLFGYCIEPGWLSYTDWKRDGWIWFFRDFFEFWIKNTSLLLPLLVAAYFVWRHLKTDFARWFAPMWLWFLVPNVIVLQPWDWDNTKFFIFWALLGSVLVGQLLAWLFTKGWPAAVAAALMLVLLGLSGTLDLWRASDFTVNGIEFTDSGGLRVSQWIRENTSPDAVFVVADDHNSPVPTLTGRRELIGYPGWLLTYGLPDYASKGDDNRRILMGDPQTPQLVAKYGVDYVMIGPQELSLGANRAYWDLHGTLVYYDGEYAIYAVNRS